jgi:ubiquinone/menaquinone biosynthesis C-methylase UbiE
MSQRVCPWWLGYLLVNPLRKLFYDPEQLLKPYLREGMTALEVGSGMGFFTLPLARLVGQTGRVVCVDLQEKMIRAVRQRASRAGLLARIELRVNTPASLGIDDLAEQADFALIFAVLHEVPDPKQFLLEIHRALKPGGVALLCEPSGHVSGPAFESTLATAQAAGFRITDFPKIKGTRSGFLAKN